MIYSAEDEAKISAVIADIASTDCSREVAIKYLDRANWHVHGALCEFGYDQYVEDMNEAIADGCFEEF